MQLDLTLACHRHRLGRSTFTRPTTVIDPSRLHVDRIANDTTARRFVEAHHYARSFPAAIASFGLFESSPSAPAELVGVATFSVPMNLGRDVSSLLEDGESACELGRFVLLDHVPHGAETFFLKRARAGLASAKVRRCGTSGSTRPKYPIVISFSDPVPRWDSSGNVAFRGHYGAIYQDSGGEGGSGTGMGLYVGRGSPKTMWIARDGSALVDRTLNKLRNGECGDASVYAMLARLGAPSIRPGEGGKEYVARALRDGPFQRARHRGNHRYIFLAGSHSRRRQLAREIGPGLPYPRWTDAPWIPPGD